MDENDRMNRVLLEILDGFANSSRKEKIAEDMLKMLNQFEFGKTFGPVIYGLRLGGANDEEIIDLMDSISGLICHAKRALEEHAYEYRIVEDE